MFVRAAALSLAFVLPTLSFAGELVGTASYRERIALPPEAQFQSILYDISGNDQVELGRFDAAGDSGPPYEFTIAYEDSAVTPEGLYAIQTKVIWPGKPFFTAGMQLEGFPANPDPEINLTMVRVEASTMDTDTSPVPAHGLQLPASFTGTIALPDDISQAWHVTLWPDQTFQMTRSSVQGGADISARAGLGHWQADPARRALILRDGAEMPIELRITNQGGLAPVGTDGMAAETPLMPAPDVELVDLNGMFLGGMMTYMADAAIFEECLSGTTFPIAMEGDYLALEKAYLADQPGPAEPLYVMIEGGIAMREGMEGPARQAVVVDRFIRTRPDVTCERQRADATLTNTYWRLDTLEGDAFPRAAAQREPHMVLEDTGYSAMVGCNRMRGGLEIGEGALSFGPGASTMMACPAPLDQWEQRFGAVMSRVARFAIEGEVLMLSDADGAPLALFTAVYF